MVFTGLFEQFPCIKVVLTSEVVDLLAQDARIFRCTVCCGHKADAWTALRGDPAIASPR